VKASGLIFILFIPIGAFVDVDEDAIRNAKPSYSARVLTAGAGINLVVGVLSLLLLLGLVSSMAPAVNGIAVEQVNLPSPASKAGILPGDFIVAVNGIQYTDGAQFSNTSWYRAGQNVMVTIWRHGIEKEIPLIVGSRSNTSLSCANPMAVGVASPCTATISDFIGSISGGEVSFDSTGPGTFNSTSCRLEGSSCGVSFTPSSTLNSPQTITASYNGTTFNLGSLRSFQVTVESVVQPPANAAAGTNNSAAASGSNASPSLGYLGAESLSLGALKGITAAYASPFQNPWQYVCIPTFPACGSRVPFSDALSGLYTSPLGSLTGSVANLIYWIFFLNFNLAIFNALPIYPLDGGQTFSVVLKGAFQGKMSEKSLSRITVAVTLAVLFLLLGVIAGPYIF
jgi:membrane-associated protease RseP (regulator of RpoE activity)